MRLNYKRLGDYIRLVDERNEGLKVKTLLGLSISKQFIPSVANIIGTDLENYKIIRKNQFACSIMQVRRDKKMPVALLQEVDEAIISQAYPVFEISQPDVLLPEYLMMWFSREEFDREACFYAVGGVRGSLEWEDFENMRLPIPITEKQKEIISEYNTIRNRILLNNNLIQNLEKTVQSIYRHWFVDFKFQNESIKSEAPPKGEFPFGWGAGSLSDIADIIMGQSPDGESYNATKNGIPLINGPVEFGEYFAEKSKWTTEPTKMSIAGDLIVCVRGSTIGRHVKSDDEYCLGRGVCSLRAKIGQRFVDAVYKDNLSKLLSYTTGSTFPNWDAVTLSKFPITVPSSQAIDQFDKKAESILKFAETKSCENTHLAALSSLLLSKLATIEDSVKPKPIPI
ncbi:restriction endonuclease subunit S [Chitinophaga alhagiae]|uniref:restriction endonuclease subunit S n=1 Tax=Chitinophaga alhagiae TaxID=2203219 RepID=UPI000E5A3F21|nr:restriction endonuclease subunit S [Chitinophaga alhagiae]